jgi:hypothetical protein
MQEKQEEAYRKYYQQKQEVNQMVSSIKDNTMRSKATIGLNKSSTRNLAFSPGFPSSTLSPRGFGQQKLNHSEMKNRIIERVNKDHIFE